MDEMIVLTLLLFPGFCGTKEIVTTVASSAFTKGLKSLHSCIFQLSGFQCKLFPFFFLYWVDEELEFCAFPYHSKNSCLDFIETHF